MVNARNITVLCMINSNSAWKTNKLWLSCSVDFQISLKKISVTTQIRPNPVSKSSKKNKCDITLIREVRVMGKYAGFE